MAETTLKKNANGYNYKYTDLAEIHAYLESRGWSYYQYIEPIDGVDYIMTVCVKDGKEEPPKRGCRVVEAVLKGTTNPVQQYGASLTYCRRYSVLMAFGLATSDDDAACCAVPKTELTRPELMDKVEALMDVKGVPIEEILKMGKINHLAELDDARLKELIKWLEVQ